MIVNWNDLPTFYKWAAQDENGWVCAYSVRPRAYTNMWWWKIDGPCGRFEVIDVLDPNPNWKNTLQKRPKKDGG